MVYQAFLWFVLKQFCLFRLFRRRFETLKPKILMFVFIKQTLKNNRNRLRSGYFRFKTIYFYFRFGDTLYVLVNTYTSLATVIFSGSILGSHGPLVWGHTQTHRNVLRTDCCVRLGLEGHLCDGALSNRFVHCVNTDPSLLSTVKNVCLNSCLFQGTILQELFSTMPVHEEICSQYGPW